MEQNSTLLSLLHKSKAVSIWNRKTGPVFWYAAGVPGPFYVNTERVIGPALAEKLLTSFNEILASTNDPLARALKLNTSVLDAYHSSEDYQTVVGELDRIGRLTFSPDTFKAISGGERRDWLFSIPLASQWKLPHLFLFKNQTSFSETPLTAAPILHVADLINNAASYFDLWLPTLAKAGHHSSHTLSVNSRGENGLNRLRDHGHKVVTVNHIDTAFFEMLKNEGLIDGATYEEIALFFSSNQEWAYRYLLTNPDLFAVNQLDKKSLSRLQFFFGEDPWKLASKNPEFFATMRQAIARRSIEAA